MITLGYIKPDGEEIDLKGYPKGGSVHLSYAKKYVKDLKKKDPNLYRKYENYIWTFGTSGRTVIDFLLDVLGWMKVGSYSRPVKYLTIAYNDEDEAHSSHNRMKIVDLYKEAKYVISDYCAPDLSEMEESPEGWLNDD